MKEEKVVRLAKPVKKGLLNLVFSRFLLILVLMGVQVLLIISMFRWLEEYVPYIATVQTLFTLAMVMYLFNSGMDSSAKLTWMLIIAVLPVVGAGLLWFTQTNLGHRVVRKRVGELIDKTRDAIPQSEAVKAALARMGYGTNTLRLPLTSMDKGLEEVLVSEMKEAGISIWSPIKKGTLCSKP